MTRYYYYIEADALIDQSTKFYWVGCGESKTGRRDCDFLKRHAADHGHYFHIGDNESAEFLRLIAHSLGLSSVNLQLVKARDLVRAFKHNVRPTLTPQALHNQHRMRFAISVDYRLSSNLYRAR